MNRRGFLSLLGMAGAASLLPGKSLVIPTPGECIAIGGRSYMLTQQVLAMEVARELDKALGDWRPVIVPADGGAKLGDRMNGATLNSRRYIHTEWEHLQQGEPIPEMEWEGTLENIRQRWAMPVAQTMAADIRHRKLRTLSYLPMPTAGAKATRLASREKGIAFRLAEQYEVESGRTLMRVDYIGSTELAA